MSVFSSGIAVVTGGASGIGLALAKRFGQDGMRVVLLDIEADALESAAEELRGYQIETSTQRCDVSDAQDVDEAMAATIADNGPVRILCNNAGVGAGGALQDVPMADWNWVMGVNLMSVVYGCQAALPHMLEHGHPSWIVNTASMAGMTGMPGMAPYCATKAAVVSLSESLQQELEGSNIGVSVLCPGWVRTRIAESRRNHPTPNAPATPASDPDRADMVRQLIENGMSPDRLAERVREAIAAQEFYIFTHPEMGSLIEDRSEALKAAMANAEASPALTR